MYLEYILLLILTALVIFIFYYMFSFFTGAPFVVTPKHVVAEMLDLAQVSRHDIVADLGSGDGRILIMAAEKGATAKGWEINPYLVLWTKLMARIHGVNNLVTVYCKPYQKADISSATVVIFYNIPGHVPFLQKKLKQELKPGTKILSYQFALDNLNLQKQTKSGIFLYKL